jgi:hypothetical protein
MESHWQVEVIGGLRVFQEIPFSNVRCFAKSQDHPCAAMTVAVPLTDLVATIQEHYENTTPYIIVADGSSHPRITHIDIRFDPPRHQQEEGSPRSSLTASAEAAATAENGSGVTIRTRLGATALRTLSANRKVSILYSCCSGGGGSGAGAKNDAGATTPQQLLSLIIDGQVEAMAEDGNVTIRPIRAIRHQARSL